MCDSYYGSLYRPGPLMPVAQIMDAVMLLASSGPLMESGGTPFYAVDFLDAVQGLGTHGTMLLWAHSTTPAGYTLTAGAVTGSIAAGGNTTSQPNLFTMNIHELLQFRFTLRPLALGAGPVADDFDIQVSLPRAMGRWAVLNDQGRLNMQAQAPLPGDSISGPAQGANIALPAAFPQLTASDLAHLSELFVYQQDTPVFTINNNGSLATVAGAAIGINVFGFRYVLRPLQRAADWVMRTLPGGVTMQAPPHFKVIPIHGRGR